MAARKVIDEARLTDKDGVKYEEFTHKCNDVEYVIRPSHVTIDEVAAFGSSKCNVCWGKGYKIVNLAKVTLRSPHDHVILSSRPFDGLSDEDKEKVIDEEKKSKTWRVLLPCDCAVKAISKKDKDFYVSNDRAIMFRVTYEEKTK
jgi:hypothetical protein